MICPDFSRELALIDQGFSYIAGADEVGRGCWAGPVVAAAVIFPAELTQNQPDWTKKIRDSKTLSTKQRTELEMLIKAEIAWAIGECDNTEIDRIGIGKATQLALTRAVANLKPQPDYVLLDGRETINAAVPQLSIIDGDALCTTIAAASIIAKNYRDKLMHELDMQYPAYGFANHVGYGTKQHVAALAAHGPCPIHRLSYKPVKAAS